MSKAVQVEVSMLAPDEGRVAWHHHNQVCGPCTAAIDLVTREDREDEGLTLPLRHTRLRENACPEGYALLAVGWAANGVCR